MNSTEETPNTKYCHSQPQMHWHKAYLFKVDDLKLYNWTSTHHWALGQHRPFNKIDIQKQQQKKHNKIFFRMAFKQAGPLVLSSVLQRISFMHSTTWRQIRNTTHSSCNSIEPNSLIWCARQVELGILHSTCKTKKCHFWPKRVSTNNLFHTQHGLPISS